jgi:hypothetical protein
LRVWTVVVDLIVPLLAVVGKTTLGGVVQALAAGGADRLAPPGVFVVGGDVADARVQPVLWGSPGRSRVDLRVSAVQRLIAERY